MWGKERKAEKPYSWFTSVKEIMENNYILSANAYHPYFGKEEKELRKPEIILKEIEKDKKGLDESLKHIKKLL